MKLGFKLTLTVMGLLLSLWVYHWTAYLFNRPSNLGVAAGVAIFAVWTFMIQPWALIQIWKTRTKEKENAKATGVGAGPSGTAA